MIVATGQLLSVIAIVPEAALQVGVADHIVCIREVRAVGLTSLALLRGGAGAEERSPPGGERSGWGVTGHRYEAKKLVGSSAMRIHIVDFGSEGGKQEVTAGEMFEDQADHDILHVKRHKSLKQLKCHYTDLTTGVESSDQDIQDILPVHTLSQYKLDPSCQERRGADGSYEEVNIECAADHSRHLTLMHQSRSEDRDKKALVDELQQLGGDGGGGHLEDSTAQLQTGDHVSQARHCCCVMVSVMVQPVPAPGVVRVQVAGKLGVET